LHFLFEFQSVRRGLHAMTGNTAFCVILLQLLARCAMTYRLERGTSVGARMTSRRLLFRGARRTQLDRQGSLKTRVGKVLLPDFSVSSVPRWGSILKRPVIGHGAEQATQQQRIEIEVPIT
jgi:hypothetical protein